MWAVIQGVRANAVARHITPDKGWGPKERD
jgi:hypothetical protein